MSTPEQSLLGKPAAYGDQYDPTLLFPIPRATKRAELGLSGQPPFFGADLWTAYELSWLTPRGKPQVAIAHVTVPCETPHIVESKSFKLYLNSFSNTPFPSLDAVRERLRADLTEAVWRGQTPGASVGVRMLLPEDFGRERIAELEGLCLDRLDIDCDRYTPAPEYLTAAFHEAPVAETLTSHLLKSNCLVTGQPDWGSVQVHYSGPQIDQGGLLRYLVSFRNHNEFHEQCVERIFMDIWRQCRPIKLSVYARYTRRGGLDINPWRTSHPGALPPHQRTARQ
ncbi:MAG: NADPH-dependent 7-cyano-7-deazaguanine reductase QueF [Ramlibacter sp.]|jgi:7-cyano-7-deazaguanine reductase|uniref:NADPH-dependent 7-cyano-7-deazaguanine reductase QueF n=1 Tax=Ramlibacter sp. TaxID=1917967 RepID=UPI0026352142|nr:NADPH-dependent 7-cyano-7-deazaguanine reductase QueF [Ramlibacter sp.]MDH4378041.1 NADPH-dependent 7-cyano-7-deazaguanine reductase QueF [Ramlibacter sp.]